MGPWLGSNPLTAAWIAPPRPHRGAQEAEEGRAGAPVARVAGPPAQRARRLFPQRKGVALEYTSSNMVICPYTHVTYLVNFT